MLTRADRKTLGEHALAVLNRLEGLPLPQRFEVLGLAVAYLNIEQARAQTERQQGGVAQDE